MDHVGARFGWGIEIETDRERDKIEGDRDRDSLLKKKIMSFYTKRQNHKVTKLNWLRQP